MYGSSFALPVAVALCFPVNISPPATPFVDAGNPALVLMYHAFLTSFLDSDVLLSDE